MITAIRAFLTNDSLAARWSRTAGWTTIGFGVGLALRFGSNLILTRLLFPEAFGLMALVLVLMIALAMFSDIGIQTSIIQSKRGDDIDFLDTAWTLQVIRGVGLWLGACLLAWPAAKFYNEPLLGQMLPVAALSMLVSGFTPARIDTAHRRLMFGRSTALDLASQTIGIAIMLLLAWLTRSIWSIVVGSLVISSAKLMLAPFIMPGRRNRFRWERSAVRELVNFGGWIFLSTVAGFIVVQIDKIALGKYLSLELFGIYSIAAALAGMPIALGSSIALRSLIPLYRERPPSASLENYQRIRQLRFGLTGALMTMVLLVAFLGSTIISALYDPRYAAAGAIVTLLACTQIPQIIMLSYDQAALAAADSRSFFYVTAIKGTAQVIFFLAGVHYGGLIGGLAGQTIAWLASYPAVVWVARRYGAWDPLHDICFSIAGFGLGAFAIWLNLDAISSLATFGTASLAIWSAT